MFTRSVYACFCMLLLITAGSAGANDAPAKTSAGLGNATIYFLLPNSFGGAIWGKLAVSPDIKVDDRKIGSLVTGSYLVVNRPTGHHVFEIDVDRFLSGPWVSEVNLTAAQAYFFEIGARPSGAPGRDLINALVSNTRGEAVPGHGIMAGLSFYSLDIEHGRAEIAKLTKLVAQ
jgi:hypothetical protein